MKRERERGDDSVSSSRPISPSLSLDMEGDEGNTLEVKISPLSQALGEGELVVLGSPGRGQKE